MILMGFELKYFHSIFDGSSITAEWRRTWKWLEVFLYIQNGWDLLLVRGSGGGWRCRRMWRLLKSRYAHSQHLCSEASPESIYSTNGHIGKKTRNWRSGGTMVSRPVIFGEFQVTDQLIRKLPPSSYRSLHRHCGFLLLLHQGCHQVPQTYAKARIYQRV